MATNQWNAEFYNDKHNFVTNYGDNVVEILNPQANEMILDLGCGSGGLTAKIAEIASKCYGIDFSAEMIAKAQQDYPAINFLQHNAEQPFPFTEKFDAVFSNAALHWMMNAEAVIKNIAASLKPNGRFVFEMGGHGNVAQVLNAIQSAAYNFDLGELELINYYPKISEYSSLLERNGFKVTFAILFERPTLLDGEQGLQNWVRMFRNNVISSIPEEQQQEFLKQVDSNGRKFLYRGGKWYADYVRLRMIAVKL